VKQIGRISSKHLIILTELLADLGNQFVQLTLLDVLIFRGDSALSSLLMMCLLEQVPSIFLSPFAGLWIDRIGAKKWLIMVSIGKCLLVGLLVFKTSLWVIFPAYLCLVVGNVLFYIGRLSLTPMLMPKKELISFNALNERISLTGRILGPFLIGWIILNTGQGVGLAVAGVLFALSACFIHRLPKLRPLASQETPTAHFPRRGYGLKPLYLKYKEPFERNHNLKVYFVIFGFVLLGGGVLNLGLPIHFKTNFGSTIAHWGLIMSGFQAGSCLSTFLLPRCSSTFRPQTILSFTFLILATAMAVLGHLTTHIQIALLMILFGCGLTLMHVFLESLIQQNSPRAYMARTISSLSAYRGACYLGTILASALVLKIWGPQALLIAASLIMVSASFLAKRQLSVWQKADFEPAPET
jgi:MFS family permease